MTIFKKVLENAYQVVKANVDTYADHFQHVSVDGVYPREENERWTASFYPGQLYLLQKATGDDELLRHRKKIMDSFRRRCDSGLGTDD